MRPASPRPQTSPRLFVDIMQPGDQGDFVIRVSEAASGALIVENRLPSASSAQDLYAFRLLESGGGMYSSQDSKMLTSDPNWWKKTDRYADIVRYGQRLFGNVFGAARTLKKTARGGERLEMIFRLHNTASELWNTPWEYMHDGEGFLVLDKKYSLIRSPVDTRLDSPEGRSGAISLPLRILIVLSDPKGVPPLNLDREVQSLLKALEVPIRAGRVILDFVEEGSLFNIEVALADSPYHILHYIGHGGMSQRGGFLALENEEGEVQPAFVNELAMLIDRAPSLRLVILNACQTGKIDQTEATSGLATGLLSKVPAVVAMQFSVADGSAQVFARDFYAALVQGVSLENAMQAGREAMQAAAPPLANWGVPALYTFQSQVRLAEPGAASRAEPPSPTLKLDGLPRPGLFVGRRDELRALRRAFPLLDVHSAFIWGMAGYGKSALARRALERPGRKDLIADVLIIACDKTPPPQLLERLTGWLAGHYPGAAGVLGDNRLPPHERIRRAAPLMQRKRTILVFDRFDAYLQPAPDGLSWAISSKPVAAFFEAIAGAAWPAFSVFTSRYRWSALNDLPEHSAFELHLNDLSAGELGMLFGEFEAVRALHPDVLNLLFEQVGGHPATWHELENGLKNTPHMARQPGSLPGIVRSWWDKTFLADLLRRLSPESRAALEKVSVLRRGLWAGYVGILNQIPEKADAEIIMASWESLSLAHFLYADEDGDPWYRIHPLVRTAVTTANDAASRRKAHTEVARMMEIDLARVAAARHQREHNTPLKVVDPFATALDELRLMMMYAPPQYAELEIGRALEWRYHLIQAGENDHAAQIATRIWGQLADRFARRDLAIELLQETVQSTQGLIQARARYALLGLRELSADTFDELLKEYRELDAIFARHKSEPDRAHVLSRRSAIAYRQGKLNDAIKLERESADTWNKLGNEVEEALSLDQLATLYQQKPDLPMALKCCQAAVTLLKKHERYNLLAGALRNQGTIAKKMGNVNAAIGSYQDALGVAQRFGTLVDVGSILGELGNLMRQVKNFETATRCFLDAIAIAEQTNDGTSLAVRLFNFSLVHEESGNPGEAFALSERALALARQHYPSLVGLVREANQRQRRARGR